VTWPASPAPVTSYTISETINNPDGSQTINNFQTNSTTFIKKITAAPDNYDGWGDPTIDETFQVVANYPGGSSLASAAVPLEFPVDISHFLWSNRGRIFGRTKPVAGHKQDHPFGV
jgi:hypothetical protein